MSQSSSSSVGRKSSFGRPPADPMDPIRFEPAAAALPPTSEVSDAEHSQQRAEDEDPEDDRKPAARPREPANQEPELDNDVGSPLPSPIDFAEIADPMQEALDNAPSTASAGMEVEAPTTPPRQNDDETELEDTPPRGSAQRPSPIMRQRPTKEVPTTRAPNRKRPLNDDSGSMSLWMAYDTRRAQGDTGCLVPDPNQDPDDPIRCFVLNTPNGNLPSTKHKIPKHSSRRGLSFRDGYGEVRKRNVLSIEYDPSRIEPSAADNPKEGSDPDPIDGLRTLPGPGNDPTSSGILVGPGYQANQLPDPKDFVAGSHTDTILHQMWDPEAVKRASLEAEVPLEEFRETLDKTFAGVSGESELYFRATLMQAVHQQNYHLTSVPDAFRSMLGDRDRLTVFRGSHGHEEMAESMNEFFDKHAVRENKDSNKIFYPWKGRKVDFFELLSKKLNINMSAVYVHYLKWEAKKRDNSTGRGDHRTKELERSRGIDDSDDVCHICKDGGHLLMCDGPCKRVFHLECLDPPLEQEPDGQWFCSSCSAEEGPTASMDITGSNERRTHGVARTDLKSLMHLHNELRHVQPAQRKQVMNAARDQHSLAQQNASPAHQHERQVPFQHTAHQSARQAIAPTPGAWLLPMTRPPVPQEGGPTGAHRLIWPNPPHWAAPVPPNLNHSDTRQVVQPRPQVPVQRVPHSTKNRDHPRPDQGQVHGDPVLGDRNASHRLAKSTQTRPHPAEPHAQRDDPPDAELQVEVVDLTVDSSKPTQKVQVHPATVRERDVGASGVSAARRRSSAAVDFNSFPICARIDSVYDCVRYFVKIPVTPNGLLLNFKSNERKRPVFGGYRRTPGDEAGLPERMKVFRNEGDVLLAVDGKTCMFDRSLEFATSSMSKKDGATYRVLLMLDAELCEENWFLKTRLIS